ncbi:MULTISPECIES: hypothetical protein [Arthrobacter]|uniref:Uncharacterized protein n=1 Tax=Arthrobacter terricola TaxID=2547396 RepID=A0A4R5KN27_9MICC|nr:MULTISPECIES: hypothetical protein [Arthrobacter]MBT8161092.1 hypothetical protein [Arthrobacter sp. GN70]TDF96946.1 hypothetical protein E1809_09530 [Arthrobacter terricola]
MKITVQRSGGVAGVTRVWTVVATSPEDKRRWMPIVEACPWDTVPPRWKVSPAEGTQAGSLQAVKSEGQASAPVSGSAGAPAGQADRFMYSIRAGQRRATLPEASITGPWHTLVENAKNEGTETLGR